MQPTSFLSPLSRLFRTSNRLLAVLGFALAAQWTALAQAADYPAKPMTVIVPFPAGGTPDILARQLSDAVARQLGQPFIVDNRGGAGGNIGAQAVARAKPDGYTLLMCAFSCSVSPLIYNPAPFNIQKDFAPVAMLGTVPSVLVVNPKVPAKTLPELLAYARANPGKLNAASSGVGGSAHLAIELLRTRAHAEVTHVPYKGAGQVAADLLAGQVDMYFDNLPASLASIKAGKLRALAVASEKRSPSIPDVPTFAEAGVPNFLITPWFGLMAPAGTPEPVLEQLNKALNNALRDPAVVSRMEQLGVVTAAGTRGALGNFIDAETAKWKDIIQKNGIRAE